MVAVSWQDRSHPTPLHQYLTCDRDLQDSESGERKYFFFWNNIWLINYLHRWLCWWFLVPDVVRLCVDSLKSPSCQWLVHSAWTIFVGLSDTVGSVQPQQSLSWSRCLKTPTVQTGKRDGKFVYITFSTGKLPSVHPFWNCLSSLWDFFP